MDTLIAENYAYEQTTSKQMLDADTFLVKQKNMTPIIDQQRGSGNYTSSKVIIDAQSFGNGSDWTNWAEAYITLPYSYTLTMAAATTSTLNSSTITDANYLIAPKNMSLVESFRVEQAGRVIVQESANLSHLVNFVKHSTVSREEMQRDVGTTLYWPDGSVNTLQAIGIAGSVNNANSSTIISNFNEGVFNRQQAILPSNRLTSYVTAAAGINEAATYQAAATFPTSLTGGAAATTVSDVHYLAVIRLKDLSDYFMKHPLSRGPGYKITLTINQAVTTITSASTTAPFNSTYTLSTTVPSINSTVQPAMLCVGANTFNATVVGGTASIYTFVLTSAIDTSGNARQSGVILNVPSVVLSEEYEAKLLANPIIHRAPFMINSAVYTNQTAGSTINLQLFSGISNPRAIVVIPQFTQVTQTQSSQMNPFNPCPGVSDAVSLTRLQVRVNSKAILPAPTSYLYSNFIDNTSRIFSLNGGLSTLTSGIISLQKFMNNYRYYAFDISLLPEDQRDVNSLITLEAFNNSAVGVDLYVFVLYEQSVTFDNLKGTIDLH